MFNRARLKLTAWYLLIIMTISLSFSAVIYRVNANEVERFDRIQRARIEILMGFPNLPSRDSSLIEDTERRLIVNLAIMNLGIFLVSGISGYILAGITLNPIKEMVDEQNRFISDASHEVNTPLTSLRTAMEVFLRSKKQTLNEANTLAQESIEEVNKLQAISKALLALSRSQIPNKKTVFEEVQVEDIITQAVKNVSRIAKQKNISVKTEVKNVKIDGSNDSLVDLFTNLIENAIKYSPAKSRVLIKANKINNDVEIQVIDQGIGIDKKDMGHIFDRFYRADTSRTKAGKTGGYGLGLSIVKKIVNAHHGRITVTSKVGKGSEFKVVLPIQQKLR